jgi:hypothetical protein
MGFENDRVDFDIFKPSLLDYSGMSRKSEGTARPLILYIPGEAASACEWPLSGRTQQWNLGAPAITSGRYHLPPLIRL